MNDKGVQKGIKSNLSAKSNKNPCNCKIFTTQCTLIYLLMRLLLMNVQPHWRSSSSDFVEKCRNHIPSQRIDPEAWVDHVAALNSLKLIEEEEELNQHQHCDAMSSVSRQHQHCDTMSSIARQHQHCDAMLSVSRQHQHCDARAYHHHQQQLRQQQQQFLQTPSTASTIRIKDLQNGKKNFIQPFNIIHKGFFFFAKFSVKTEMMIT
jgi:hypothetical protein